MQGWRIVCVGHLDRLTGADELDGVLGHSGVPADPSKRVPLDRVAVAGTEGVRET